MKRFRSWLVASLCILFLASSVSAQLRIVTYNTANGSFSGNNIFPRTGMDNVLQAIANEVTNGIAKPIDVLILQEQDEPTTSTQAFVDLLNGIYGAGTYARSTVVTGPSSSSIRQTLIYNTNTVSLINEVAFGSTGTSGAARQTARFQLRPVGYDGAADFYVYNNHYKASYEQENQVRRNVEAMAARANADALGQGASIIYAGDYNVESSDEAMFQTLTSSGNGQAFDPINASGFWWNNPAFADIHTQSPHDGSDELATGGMDDRFDFQLVTGELLDHEGMSYIENSYHAFGNNGTTFNQAVNAASNTYPLSQSLLDDLAHVSDHLPVVADYQLPAKMGVNVSAIPSAVIVGAAVNVDVTVTNVAPVSFANGADELDYLLGGSGDLTGNASGIANPLSSGNLHQLAMDTSVAGPANGTLTVSSTSQSVADGTYFDNLSLTVLDHAVASFADSVDQDLLTIDFGSLPVGGVLDQAFTIHNLVATLGFTADLDLDAILGSGDTGILTTDLAAFSGLAAAASNAFLASFDTSNAGLFNATYTLNLSDEDVPGATSQTLTLQLVGEVTAALLTGDLNGDGFVGLGDVDIVLTNWNATVTPGLLLAGDPSGDGYVGLDDLDMVLGNWNAGTPPGDAQIPEPSALALAGLAGLTLLARRGAYCSIASVKMA